MLAALDSNFIIYAEDMFTDSRRQTALAILRRLPAERIVVPVQAAGEVLSWLVKKGRVPKALAAERARLWLERYRPQATTASVMDAARDLLRLHHLQVWDAVIFAAAAEAGADLLITEDMQDGFTWRGVTAVNPFTANLSPLLQQLFKH